MLFWTYQGRWSRLGALVIAPIVGASLLLTGCTDSGRRPPPVAAMPVGKDAEPTVDAILDRTIKAYQDAKSYRDEGKIILVAKTPQGDEKVEFDCRVEFQRPNLLRIEFQFADPSSEPRQVLVIGDGKRIFSKMQGFDNQVVVTADPATIEVPKIYESEGIVLPDGITGRSFVLDLLAAKKPLAELDRGKAKLLDTARIDGKPYDRVQFDTDQGKVVLWINQQTSVVRRVEHPTKAMLEALKEQGVKGLDITSDFVDATLDPKIEPARFTWPADKEEHFVRQLVPPVDPAEAPSALLGKPVPEFKFVTAAGEERESKSLSGKVTVIDFWATWCGFCLKGMPGVEEVRKKYAGNDKVQFLAMSVDSPDITNADIVATLKRIKCDPPWARMALKDPKEFYDMFQVGGIPAMAIISADGHVQMLHIGMDPRIMENLPPKIDALLKGEDLAKQATEAWDVKMRDYKRKVKEATVDIQAVIVDIPRAQVAKASQPVQFQLAPLWTAADVKEPGNLLVPSQSSAEQKGTNDQIFVIDQIHDVVELDATGKIVARHKNVAATDSPLTWIHSAADKEGKRLFVIGGLGQSQFHVFDDRWERVLSYPTDGEAQVFDVVPADLDGDGKLELCVGYYGAAGLQVVSLDGKRLWNNRTLESVNDIAVTEPDSNGKRRVLCTHQGGTLAVFSSDGQADTPLQLPQFAVMQVSSADLDGDGRNEYCVLAADDAGSRQLVGLRMGPLGGEFTWRRPIPSGEHDRPLEALTSGQFSAGQPAVWIVAGADGSVNVFSADGTPVDQFNTGDILTGLAAATIDSKPALLISHPDRLLALRVEKKL